MQCPLLNVPVTPLRQTGGLGVERLGDFDGGQGESELVHRLRFRVHRGCHDGRRARYSSNPVGSTAATTVLRHVKKGEAEPSAS